VRAESLQTDVSTIGGLSIFRRFAGQEHERAWTSGNDRSQRCTAHCLAVCAVANGRRFGIGFGLERHVAAVTASINFHDRFPRIPQVGMDDSCVLDKYVGNFPFDKVNGRTIYQVPKVRQSMEKLLGKERPKITRALRDFDRGGVIESLDSPQLGRLILAFQCMKHVCVNQVALFLRPDGEAVAACLSQLDKQGPGTTTEWIGKAGKRPLKTAKPDAARARQTKLSRLTEAKKRAQGEQ